MTHTARNLYPHVVSTLALVVALGSGGAYAAGLAKNSVASKQIKDGAIKVVDLDDGSVTADKLAPGAVPNPLTDGSVSSAKLANGSVTAAKLAPGAVPPATVPDGSVTGAKLADDSVTGAKVTDNSLTGGDINESTLGTVDRASNVMAASISAAGVNSGNQSYQVASSSHVNTGLYEVTFTRSIVNCSLLATPATTAGTSNPIVGTALTTYLTPTSVRVNTYNYTFNSYDMPFVVLAVC